jgi:hypothetical protein
MRQRARCAHLKSCNCFAAFTLHCWSHPASAHFTQHGLQLTAGENGSGVGMHGRAYDAAGKRSDPRFTINAILVNTLPQRRRRLLQLKLCRVVDDGARKSLLQSLHERLQ